MTQNKERRDFALQATLDTLGRLNKALQQENDERMAEICLKEIVQFTMELEKEIDRTGYKPSVKFLEESTAAMESFLNEHYSHLDTHLN